MLFFIELVDKSQLLLYYNDILGGIMNSENLREKGLEELRNLTIIQRSDIKKLIDIEKKYGLGYNNIVEFCNKKFKNAMYVLTHYCQLKFSVVLQLIMINENKIKDDLTNAQIVSIFTGMSEKRAEKLVADTDHLFQKRNELFAERFSNGLARSINRTFSAHAGRLKDAEKAEKAGMTVDQDLFSIAFNTFLDEETI